MILNIIFFLISIMILAVIYILLRRRIDKLTDTDMVSDELAKNLDVILSEINQATDRNVLIIEDKIAALETLIDKAEKRITLLNKIVHSDADTAERAAVKDRENRKQDKIREPETEPGELTYSHLNKMNIMSGLVTPLAIKEKIPENRETVKDKILSLYRNGIDAAIIASSVGVNRGEVELIISLYKQTNSGQD